MQLLRQRLTLLLLALLPFHAFAVTVGTLLLAGPGNSPLGALAIWKEVLLLFVLGIASLEYIHALFTQCKKPKIDILDILIIALLILGVFVSYSQFSTLNSQFLYGIRYDFVPLIAFVVLRRVQWSDDFLPKACKVIVWSAAVVCAWGIASMYLPQEFFVRLGYSDLHSLYRADGPVAAFQQIGGTSIRRLQSTMSGPNQLGLWLIIPLSILLSQGKKAGRFSAAITLFVVLCILLTLSRSAWIAALVIVSIVAFKKLPRQAIKRIFGFCGCMSIVLLFAIHAIAPEVILRAASTKDHIARPLHALQIITENPWGLGLGSAGPASNRVSDTCIFLPEDADASWAQDRPSLCVFTGQTQVQPKDRQCLCPLVPENWYLQIGIEMGVLGLAIYMLLMVLIGKRLFVSSFARKNETTKKQNNGAVVALAFLGVCIAALFLHAWEDSAVAYTLWVLIAVLLCCKSNK